MPYLSIFEQNASSEVVARLSPAPSLREALERQFKKGRERFPEVSLDVLKFVAFLARHLPPEIADDKALAALNGHEIYLVCAYANGDRSAGEILESRYLTSARTALLRLRATDELIADILQDLRRMLIEMEDEKTDRRGYSGRGDLAGWLRVVAVRKAGQRLRQGQRLRGLDETAIDLLLPESEAAETALMRQRYKQDFAEAYRSAVASLTSRERNLLRYYFLFRLTIDQVAHIYGIHRATAARWIDAAQTRLAERTREEFQRRVPLTDDSAARLMALLHSQLSVSLGDWLHREAEPEKSP